MTDDTKEFMQELGTYHEFKKRVLKLLAESKANARIFEPTHEAWEPE